MLCYLYKEINLRCVENRREIVAQGLVGERLFSKAYNTEVHDKIQKYICFEFYSKCNMTEAEEDSPMLLQG